MNLKKALGISIMVLTLLLTMLELQMAFCILGDIKAVWGDIYLFFMYHILIFGFGAYLYVFDKPNKNQ